MLSFGELDKDKFQNEKEYELNAVIESSNEDGDEYYKEFNQNLNINKSSSLVKNREIILQNQIQN